MPSQGIKKEKEKSLYSNWNEKKKRVSYYFSVGSFDFLTWQRKFTASTYTCSLRSWCIHFCRSVSVEKRNKSICFIVKSVTPKHTFDLASIILGHYVPEAMKPCCYPWSSEGLLLPMKQWNPAGIPETMKAFPEAMNAGYYPWNNEGLLLSLKLLCWVLGNIMVSKRSWQWVRDALQ